MVPVKQRNLHAPELGVWGDCHRAAVASVLELPYEDVPHFGDGGPGSDEFFRREKVFLAEHGLVPILVVYDATLEQVFRVVVAHNPDVYYLLGGTSKNGTAHTVVGLNDQIVHDPAMDSSGIVGPLDGYYWLTFIGSGRGMKPVHEAVDGAGSGG